ncbi:hypothetical protein FRC06_004053 [Ceratobasidium sp. 370]|nr:hypothetical protein FRC06_004053 [Ceratobasidium sp. 370]
MYLESGVSSVTRGSQDWSVHIVHMQQAIRWPPKPELGEVIWSSWADIDIGPQVYRFASKSAQFTSSPSTWVEAPSSVKKNPSAFSAELAVGSSFVGFAADNVDAEELDGAHAPTSIAIASFSITSPHNEIE